jgi:hypothetical protein
MNINKKYPNFQDLYTFQDYKLVADAKKTFDCGISPICLLARNQHSRAGNLTIRTLRLEYAIQVWMKAVLISADYPNPLFYYWWLNYEDNDTSFRDIKYYNFYGQATPGEMVEGFWKLLKNIADSRSISVHEGLLYTNKMERLISKPTINFCVVLDIDDAKDACKKVDDVFNYPYDLTPKTYTWEQIKDLFVQLNLHQLSLTDIEQLHRNTEIDEMLFCACDHLDIEGVKTSVRMGANVNAIDKIGESALGHAISDFTQNGILMDKEYTDEERQTIERSNYKKCVEIVDYLLSLGADIDLYGVDGMQPITHAYYAHSIEMIKHLLEKGSNPNYNSFRSSDLFFYSEDSCRCTILDLINGLIYEDYDDYEKKIESLVRQYGGRLYTWDLDIDRWKHIGKYYLFMMAGNDKYLFFDNGERGVGDEQKITIENEDEIQTTLELIKIDGLYEWNQEYLQNIENPAFKWSTWRDRGYKLAQLVAQQLPDTVALYYPYGYNPKWKYSNWTEKHYLKTLRKKILVSQNR